MRRVDSSQFTVNSRRRKTGNAWDTTEWDFNTEGTEGAEEEGEESVRDGAR